MPAFRDALTEAGFDDVRTYLQSGNAVLTSTAGPDRVARSCKTIVADTFGLDVDVVVRRQADLARIVRANPLGKIASDPKRYQVSFLASKPPAALVKRLEAARAEPERLAVVGREIYAWHPAGVARSKLWTLLAGKDLGVTATSRNWTTVTSLLELAKER
jgi:uncharacterized protein (DUF1697 family)